MEQDFFAFILDFIKLLQDPNIENHIKEKAIKSFLKQSVDNQQNYGCQTKQDLKLLIDLAPNDKTLFETIGTYFCTHDTRY